MHAFLVIVNREELIVNKLAELQHKLKITRTLEFALAKIEDVRELSKFTKLSLSAPTAILLKNIDRATPEALTAFLKNLEEPQEMLFYFLTAQSVSKVLPTVVSRCEVIKVQSIKYQVQNEEQNFLALPVGEKLTYIDKIKDREEAAAFVERLISYSHHNLIRGPQNFKQTGEIINAELLALSALYANGNVSLQLTNLAIKVAQFQV